MGTDWKQIATQKRDSVNALIPEEWRLKSVPSAEEQRDITGTYLHQYLSSKEVEITETDAVGIAAKTTKGEWTAVEVTKAFCHRAALAHQFLSCLHEIFFDAAMQDAQRLDEYYKKEGKPMGPLHGLPVSLKDQFHVKGQETHMGYVGWLGTFQGKKDHPHAKTREFESEMVRELRSLGAVLYVKTSVPHTLMAGETANNIIGYTWNAKNRLLSCGGSSGGEGALIGAKGSPVGFGTDIGGSIRIPAAFNGVYGIRPSSGRLPYEGMANSMEGQNSILSVVGPLGGSVGALRLLVKSLLQTQPWLHDPLVNELPWREEKEKETIQSKEKLVFGLFRDDNIVKPTPPVRRAVDELAKLLESKGHKVVEWKPPSHEPILDVTFKTWTYDGGRDIHENLGLAGEPMIDQIKGLYETVKPQFSASDICATNVRQRELQKEYMEYWNSTSESTGTGKPIDAFIAPLAPFPAARPKGYKYYGYSVFVNCLDYTSVVVPVTQANKTKDPKDEGYEARNETDKAVWETCESNEFQWMLGVNEADMN